MQLRNVHAVALHEAPQAKADHGHIEHERKPLAAHDEHEIEEKVERVVRHGDGVDLFADGDGVDLGNERRVVERSIRVDTREYASVCTSQRGKGEKEHEKSYLSAAELKVEIGLPADDKEQQHHNANHKQPEDAVPRKERVVRDALEGRVENLRENEANAINRHARKNTIKYSFNLFSTKFQFRDEIVLSRQLNPDAPAGRHS